MKKFFSFLIIVILVYLMLVFVKPNISDTIGGFIGLKELNQKIRNLKSGLDKTATSDDLLKGYSDTIESARDLKDQMFERSEDVKNKVDAVRSTLSWAEQVVNEAKDTVDSVNKTLNDVNKLWESIKSIVNTGAIQ